MIASVSILFAVVLELPVSGPETYFFDLGEAKAVSSTIALKTPSGESIPFSLDPRVDFREGEIRPPIDGRYSTTSAPASEDRYRRLGWLSFRAPEGVTKCLFSFETGDGGCVACPNPDVRPDWVELFKGRLPEKLTGNVRFGSSDFVDVSSFGGRRIVSLLRTHATEAGVPGYPYYRLSLPNAKRVVKSTVNNFYFSTANEGLDCCCEGMAPPVEKLEFIDGKNALTISSCMRSKPDKLPLCIDFLHIQAPPDASLGKLGLLSDMWYVGDTVTVVFQKCRGLVRVPFEASGIRGERVMNLSEDDRLDARLSLKDADGRLVRAVEGAKIVLDGIVPGNYRLGVDMSIRGAAVAPVVLPLKVITSPFSPQSS